MSEDKSDNIRTIVVDDSPTARQLLVAILEAAGDIQVVGVGDDGEDVIALTKELHPDVIVMGVCMSQMDGLAATRRIMQEMPTPIVIVTSSLRLRPVDLPLDAGQNAPKVVRKPSLAEPETCDKVIETVRTMAQVHSVLQERREGAAAPPAAVELERRAFSAIGIAASVGGPAALVAVLRELGADFPVPILIVPHIAPGLVAEFVRWLDAQTPLRVAEAVDGSELQSGVVLVAPYDYHLRVNSRGAVELNRESPYKGLRPSANHLFYSLAYAYGAQTAGIVLTGLSDDGAVGLEVLHMAGGVTIAQDEQSCVARDMPQAAISRGAVDLVLSPEQIARKIRELLQL